MNLNRTSLRWLYWKLRKWKGKKRNPKNHRTGRREFPLCPLQASGQTGKIVTTIIFARRLFRSAFKLSILFYENGLLATLVPHVRARTHLHTRTRPYTRRIHRRRMPKSSLSVSWLASVIIWRVVVCGGVCVRLWTCVRVRSRRVFVNLRPKVLFYSLASV